MPPTLIIAKKEFKGYFTSPIAYVYLSTFLVLSSWFFFRTFFLNGQTILRAYFGITPWLFLFFIPAVAMSKWSEESRLGTDEILFTLPLSDFSILFGKFLSGFFFVALSIFLSFPLAFTCSRLGKLDWGPVMGGYLALLFLASAYLAIGLFASALSKNQIVAFIIGLILCFIFSILGEPMVLTNIPHFLVPIFDYLSLQNHFDSIARGVLDTRDLIFYLSMIFVFLYLNSLAIARRLFVFPLSPGGRGLGRGGKIGTLSLFTLSLLGILVILNFLASRHFARIDLTQEKNYTLSPSSQEILKKLDDVILVKLYLSKELPTPVAHLKQEIQDLLDEYRRASRNKIQISLIDPAEDPKEEQKINFLGIPPVELSVIEKDQRQLKKIYLGMGLFYEDKTETIPVITEIKDLEYQLTSAILKLTSKELKTVGIVTTDPSGFEKDYSALKKLLEKSYRVLVIDPSKDETLSDKKIHTLLVIAPPTFSEGMRYEIDQFLMRGGHAIFLVDRVKVDDQLEATPLSPNLEEMLEHYGAKVNEDLVADRANAPAVFSSGVVQYQVSYPLWLKVITQGIETSHPITSRISSVVLPWSSSIESTLPEGSKVQAHYLLKSTPDAWALKPPYLLQPQMIMANAPETTSTYSLATLLTGPLPSFFKGKEIPRVKKEGVEDKSLQPNDAIEEAQDAILLVVGNSRFVADDFLKQFEDNLVFFMNAVDWMTLGDALIGIRSKIITDRPLKELGETQKNWIKRINTYGIALGVIIFGIVFNVIQKRRNRRLAQKFS
jgi:ABC-2 type transport system permease protein